MSVDKYSEVFDEWIKFLKFIFFISLPIIIISVILVVTEISILGYYSVIFGFISVPFKYLIFKKKAKKHNLETYFTNKNVTLWIRKFAKDSDTYKTQSFVETIMYPWRKALTLADKNTKLGSEQRVILKKMIIPESLLFATTILILSYDDSIEIYIHVIIFLSITIFSSYLIWKDNLKNGRIKITKKNISKLDIKKRKIGRKTFNSTVMKVSSKGDLWWEVILKITPSVSAVIVDCEDIILESVSLQREIHHFIETIGTRRIILLTNGNDKAEVLKLYPKLGDSLFIKKPTRMGFRFFSKEYRDISIQIAPIIYGS